MGQALERVYDLQLEADLIPGPNPVPDQEREAAGAKLRLKGQWVITLVDKAQDGDVVLAQVRPSSLDVNAPKTNTVTPSEYREWYQRELARPALLKVSREGRVVETKLPGDLAASASGLIRSIAAQAQFGVPRGTGTNRKGLELDGSGEYEAEYSLTSSHLWERKKLGYQRLDTGEGLRPASAGEHDVLASRSRFTWAADSGLQSLDTLEDLRVNPGPGLPPMLSRSKLKLVLSSQGTVPRPEAELGELRARPWFAISRQPPAEAHQFELDLAKVGDYRSVEEILGALDETKDDSDKQNRLLIALGAFLRLKPDSINEVERALKSRSPHTEVLLRALTRADTPRSQALVLSALQHQKGLSNRSKGEILVSLSLSREPTEPLVRGLQALIADPLLGGQAMLGLGSVAFRLKETHPALAEEIMQTLENQLDSATRAGSFRQAKTVLRAFGNSGNLATVAMLEPYLKSPQAPVRAAALGALRRIPDASVDKLLESFASGDTDEEVRTAAKRTLDARKEKWPEWRQQAVL